MPVRRLKPPIKEEKVVISLRRSPRFLQFKKTDEISPRTPKCAPREACNLSPQGILGPKSQEKCEKYILTRNRKTAGLKSSEKSNVGFRRSVRLDRGVGLGRNVTGVDLQKRFVIEKRVTKSSVRGSTSAKNDARQIFSVEDSSKNLRVLSKDGKSSLGNPSLNIIEKRVTRSSSKTGFIGNVEASVGNRDIVVLSDVRKPKRDSKFCRSSKTESNAMEYEIKRLSSDKKYERTVQIGGKRKRKLNQMEEECKRAQGWTKEQEIALKRAYFSAKPTPNFWKEVSRMVPGKSAKECLDRIHSDQLTPQPRTRPKSNKNKPSPLSFSASKLFSIPETKTRKRKPSRRKGHLSQKMVRQLLQRQHNKDQDYEADLFNILEPTFDSPSLNFLDSPAFASPTPNLCHGLLTRCRETSSSSRKKQLSQLNISGEMTFSSPPVLKQIKNKALHERYIDQLHCRDAKRKAVSSRNGKLVGYKSNENTSILAVNPVKLARDALVSDAQDAINQLRSLQSNIMHNFDYDSCGGNEDEDEDEL